MFNRLFGRTGVLRQNGITAVLATHATHRLSFADSIIILDSHGRLVTDHGMYLSSIGAKSSAQDHEQERIVPVANTTTQEVLDNVCEETVADADKTRSAGDWTTYIHYFQSCGWVDAICFGFGLCGFAVCMRIPGMAPPAGATRLNKQTSADVYSRCLDHLLDSRCT